MSVSITSTYAGEFSGKYIAAALLSAETLDKGGLTIMPNVKYKSVIKKAATDDIVKDATCDFQTGQGTLTLTEAILQPEEFQVNMDICKKDLHSDW
jgi:5-enolpyruvylshikimate-3-phosphate synthase